MNWTAWNSVEANALTNSPSAMPSTALAIARTTTSPREPATSRPSSPKATATVTSAWTAATAPKARP